MVCAVTAAMTLSSGCIEGDIGEPGTSCTSTRSYFLTDVWGPVLAQKCVGCHAPGGTAQLRGARFQLLPGSYPDFADANLSSVFTMANQSYNVNGTSVAALLAKPLGLVPHGGGAVLRDGSAEHVALKSLVDRLTNEADSNACRDYGSLAAPSGVVMLDWRSTLRKASLDMLGRLPTAEESARATDEAGFDAVFATMIESQPFYDRWRSAWNDLMLTDRYVSNNGCDQRALNLVSGDDFPNRGTYGGEGGPTGLNCCGSDRNNTACAPVQEFFLAANNAIAREPVNLFEYIVRGNRPFSEIVTADYTLVNPQSAHVYGVSDQVTFSSYDSSEIKPARIRYTRHYNATDSESMDFPHAGVLTMPAFLSRYPTTATNRNRHRARIVQSYFLATDILKVGERPLDPAASEALVQAPTLNYGPCVTCHRINDPIAGAFRGFYPDRVEWRFNPRDAWYTDMAPPGFAGEDMLGTNYRSALRWLAPRIANDPRFAMSAVRFAYKSLTGREPLSHPTESVDPLYDARAAAWNEQDRVFRAIARRFVATNMNFKTIVTEMVKSPLYRATNVVGITQVAQTAAHAGLGTAMLVSPEILDRRIRAIAGFGWVRNPANDMMRKDGWLVNDFYFSYGGIDSDTIVRRTTDASGIITGVAQRMANEVACRGTASDFVLPQESRRFFRRVRVDTVPESAGQAVPGSVAQIRQNIAELHALILGENLSPDSAEVTRTYTLFLETWREVTASSVPPTIPNDCKALRDLNTNEMLPMAQQIHEDRSGSIRAWMAVLSYLFSDYRFLYQ
jgi:hypothetical protein